VENLEKLKILTLKLDKCGARNVTTKKMKNRKEGGRNSKMKNRILTTNGELTLADFT